jgi:hypothetical protein
VPVLVSQLPGALNQDVSLAAISSSTICSEVSASPDFTKTPSSGLAPSPKTPTVLAPVPTLYTEPIDLLRILGLAMLPLRHVQQNLASWHWTLIRYGYLIASAPGAPLATNGLVGDYKHHHMTALSEAFGVGCALTYARSWLESQVPRTAIVHDPVDFDYLIAPGTPPPPGLPQAAMPQAAPHSTRRPDYLMVAEQPDRTIRLLVVECKGNSGASRSRSIRQLGSAMHQLEGITFSAPAGGAVAVDRHAYATRVTKSGGAVELLAVDPPAKGDRWTRMDASPSEDEFTAARDEEGILSLPTPDRVGRRYVDRLSSRALSWSGADEAVSRGDVDRLQHRESDHGDVAGATSSLRLPDGQRIEVFTGALVETLRAARDTDPERARQLRVEVYDKLARERAGSDVPADAADTHIDSWRAPAVPLRAADDPERVASAVSDDGVALQIEVH